MHTTPLYQIAVPVSKNDGTFYTAEPYRRFEHAMLDAVGGWTYVGTHEGAWRDEDTMKMYREDMRHYQVLANSAGLAAILLSARAEFPDQIAFFAAKIGEGFNFSAKLIDEPMPPLAARVGL